jgi:ammonia channel protein AmtB
MTDNEPTSASRRIRRLAGVVGLLLMGWIDGGALAATSSASMAVTSTSTAAASAAVCPRNPSQYRHRRMRR